MAVAIIFLPAQVLLAPATSLAFADTITTGIIAGVAVDGSGTPIPNVQITVTAAQRHYGGRSDRSGNFSVGPMPAGTYLITALANGYQRIDGLVVAVSGSEMTRMRLVLSRAAANAVSVLGLVTVNGSRALSTASAPSTTIDPQDLAGRGVEQLSSLLAQQIAVTVTRQLGGAPGLPQSVSIRGPDPSETAIDIDGHQVNNSSTGDFDLELLDPAEFADVQVVYGIGPSSLLGANAQGGTINFRTIEPTSDDRGQIRLTGGSFGIFAETAQATGTDDRFGYAFSWHHYTTQGEINNYPIATDASGKIARVGSGINALTSLAKIRYALDGGLGFAEITYRDTVASRDLSAALSEPDNPNVTGPGAPFTNVHAPGAAALTNSPALGLDLQLPLGRLTSSGAADATIIARHLTDTTAQSTANIDPALNPYLIDQRDRVDDDSGEYDIYTANAITTLEADVRRESLTAPVVLAPGPGTEAQTQRSIVGRSVWSPTSHLHYTAAAYVSRYDTFGSSTDPRFAIVWTPSMNAVLRLSVGTAFRAPLLSERAFNPALTAERTTEYELGYEIRTDATATPGTAALNVYRTNLRDPIFFNVNAAGQLTFLENLGRVAYEGAELRYEKPLANESTLHASYGIDIAYPVNNPFAHDPAAPNVVAGEQFQGIPPHKALLGLDHRSAGGFDLGMNVSYESSNNALNRPAYVMLDANVAKTVGRTQFALLLHNLTNQFDDRFTLPADGVPYPTPAGLAPTNAYSLQGRSISVSITRKL